MTAIESCTWCPKKPCVFTTSAPERQARIADQLTDDHLAGQVDDHLAGQVGKDGAPPGGPHAAGQLHDLLNRGDLLHGGDWLHPPAAANLDHEHPRGFQS